MILAAAAGHCYAAPVARIHIVGASGSGTTTLAIALAREIGGAHLDTDDFYWLPTDPPFTTKRPVEQRLKLLEAELTRGSCQVKLEYCRYGVLRRCPDRERPLILRQFSAHRIAAEWPKSAYTWLT